MPMKRYSLHFWNRKRLVSKYERLLGEEIINNEQVIMCELLEGEFVLVSRYSYSFD